MKKFLVLSFVMFAIFSQTSFASFNDVPTDHPYSKAINWLQANGVIKGYEDGTFKPDQPVNRAEFLKMLYWTKGIGEPVVVKPTYPFADVKGGEWYANYVEDAYVYGVINGYADGTFQAGNPINVAEALKIVLNVFIDPDDFYSAMAGDYQCPFRNVGLSKVVGVDAWYYKYAYVADGICALPDKMVLDSKGNLSFNAGKKLTRAEMAELIYRVKTVKDNSFYVNDGSGMVQEYASYDALIQPKDVTFPNEFKISDLKIGQKFIGYTIVAIKAANDELPQTDENIDILFDGLVSVSGEYDWNDFLSNICFTPDDKSLLKLPKLMNDTRYSWFCFENMDETKLKLGVKGKATIVIDNFRYILLPAEVSNLVTLVDVVEKELILSDAQRPGYNKCNNLKGSPYLDMSKLTGQIEIFCRFDDGECTQNELDSTQCYKQK